MKLTPCAFSFGVSVNLRHATLASAGVMAPVLIGLTCLLYAGDEQGSGSRAAEDEVASRGPELFSQHCSECHTHRDADGKGIEASEPGGANLYGFASKKWLTGLFDPEQVDGEHYFGNTRFRRGEMADYVKEVLPELRESEDFGEESFGSLVEVLAAESILESPREVDGDKIDGISEETMFLFQDFGCVDCHRFYTEGFSDGAPDLTGYGSREWLIGMISDPGHKRFYGRTNDMPAYRAESEEAVLSEGEVRLLADWLRTAGRPTAE